jgi:hypothetical protein
MAGIRIAGDASSASGRKQKPYAITAYWSSGVPAIIVRGPSSLLSIRTTTFCVFVLALAFLAGSVARPAAAAHKPACWQVLLNDWYDGRIDGTYPIHCYREALKHLPSDVDTYSSARDDIERALQSARLAARSTGKSLDPNTLIQPSAPGTKPTSTVASKTGTKSRGKPTAKGGSKDVITIAAPGRKQGTGIAKVADNLNGGGASSLPLPLLILGGLALLLVALGGAGLVWRHFQGRRPAS